MSLEDSAPVSEDALEVGDVLCTLPPGKVNLVVGEFYIMNHGKYSMFYYVQCEAPNPLTEPPTAERILIHFIPKSREDELKPE